MKEIWLLYKKSYGVLSKNFNKFIAYQLIASLILTLLLLPFLKGVFNVLMKSSGLDYITNGLLQKFLISPQGILMILISLIIAFMIVIIEIGGLIVLSFQCLQGVGDNKFIDIIIYTLKRIKYMFGFDGLIIALYFILIAPMLDSNLTASLFSELKIPGFIMQVIESNMLYTFLLVFVTFAVFVFSIRWMFALHVLLIDKNVNKKFLSKSSKILKNKFKYVVKYAFFTFVFNLIATIIIALIFLSIFALITLLIPISLELNVIIILIFLLFAFLFFSAISVPLTVLKLTILYLELTDIEYSLEIKIIKLKSIFNKVFSNKLFMGIILLLIIAATIIYDVILEDSFNEVKYDVGITAHRGSSFEAPENTMSAIQLAYENGADYVEIDVQLTKDHQLILLHDETFERTSSSKLRPHELTLAEIKEFDAGLWFNEKFYGEEIATLQEVMTYSKNKMKLNIEIKGSYYSPQIYHALIQLINLNNFKNDCVITSLNYEDLVSIEEHAPYLKTGYIMFLAIGDLEKLNVDFYSVEESNVNEKFVQKAHDIGREVHVWTINDKADMRNMLNLGVDNIITDYDKDLKKLINELKNDITE